MREIVLDTETTGLSFANGHRIVEIGCIELKNGLETGEVFHCYLNPERDMPEEAFRVHGLGLDFLKKQPVFSSIAQNLLSFLSNSRLVIHNARFDLSFLNGELNLLGHPILTNEVIDTLTLAKKNFPGTSASLDALCRHFKIDLSARKHHGALLDAQLLTEVYLCLLGSRQKELFLNDKQKNISKIITKEEVLQIVQQRTIRKKREFALSLEEKKKHEELCKKIGLS